MAGPLVVLSHTHGQVVKKDTVVPLVATVTPVGASPVVPAPVTVDVNAIARVEYRVNGKLVVTITAPPYSFNFDPTGHSGEVYQIEVTAWDNSNRSSVAESTLKIS